MLNLSYNKLEGRVPESPYFMTFFNGSFLGNDGLHGPLLSKECNNTTLATVMAPHHFEKKSIKILCYSSLSDQDLMLRLPLQQLQCLGDFQLQNDLEKAGSLVNYVSILNKFPVPGLFFYLLAIIMVVLGTVLPLLSQWNHTDLLK